MNKINVTNGIIPILAGIVFFLPLSTSNLYSQCGMVQGHGNHSGHSGYDMQKTEEKADTTIIRKGIIKVDDIDINMDGYVYQDQMDWNIISDNAGKCPICGWNYKRLTLTKQ